MDQWLVPIVLTAVALLVAWILYDQRYGFRRQMATIRRVQGAEAANAIVEAARHLMAEGWGEANAYARAIESHVKDAGEAVKVETERRVRTSSIKAVEAHVEHEQRKTETRLRVLVKHSEGIIPGQGPAKKVPTPPPSSSEGKGLIGKKKPSQ